MGDDDADPYYDDLDDDPCDHDDYDVDILEGRWRCYRCGDGGWLSGDQLRHELRLNAMRCEETPND